MSMKFVVAFNFSWCIFIVYFFIINELFYYAMHLHWPHAGVHWRPFFKQVQDRVSHLLPQLHLMFRRSCTKAAGSDICTGTRPVEDPAHPQSSGERCLYLPKDMVAVKSGSVWCRQKLPWWYISSCCGHLRLKLLEPCSFQIIYLASIHDE